MLKNYFKIAFRNLIKNKTYSSINIFGLSIGIACCMLILLYITNEFSYDKFHKNSDRIYRTWIHEDYGDGSIYWNTVSPLRLREAISENIPEAEHVVRRHIYTDQVKTSENAEAFSEPIQLVDPGFFSMFDFKLLKGDPSSVFAQTSNVVLTPSSAERFFGTTDVLDKTLLLKVDDQFLPFTVTGIIQDSPTNSSIQYQLLIPFENGRKIFSQGSYDGWFSVTPETYVQLNQQAQVDETRAKLVTMMQQELGERWAESQYTVGLQPITDIRLNPSVPVGLSRVNDPIYLYMLSGIAFLILLIACVNFMTLSISRSTSRAKEVGIRKTIGAARSHLMYQFWGEALLMTVFALGVGLFFAELLLPFFNSLSGTELDLGLSTNNMLLFLGLGAFISLVAGIYPALILSGFKPVEVLKGKIQVKGDKSLFRTGMVVFQFTLTIFLIASTMSIRDQLDYMRSKDLGFQKEHVVVLDVTDQPNRETGFMGLIERTNNTVELLNNQLASIPEVEGVSTSLHTPAESRWINADYRDTEEKIHDFNMNIVGHTYPELMDFKFTEGRSFSEEISSDANRAIIVNQAFVDEHGWEDPLNSKLLSPGFDDHEVIGVVKNFNYSSLRSVVEPLVLVLNPRIIFSGIDNINFNGTSPTISIKISSTNVPSTIDKIEQAWNQVNPGIPFNMSFLDQAIDNQYQQEERLSKIVTFGSSLAIIIACLGLFGLASLLIVRKTKEIGIRKVLGASSQGIVILVNKEFTKLVAISFLLAVPMIWYAIDLWLQNFAYQVGLSVWTFIIAGIITVFIAWISVSYQSFKATTINPVESLKGE